jgi:membrane-associated phospholipid phosphatase
VIGDSHRVIGVARVNTAVLSRVSHQLNTFPSGHVAVAIAAALSVWPVMPLAAAAFGMIALGVAIGAVTGRYHYVLDVVTGAMAGVISAVIAASFA